MYGAREVVAPASRALSVTYDGTVGRITRIALRNALFNLLTLGIYRFWAKTRLRRYIWASVTFDGDRLEYTGRPVELLLGFLVAFVVLAVFFGIVLLATPRDHNFFAIAWRRLQGRRRVLCRWSSVIWV